MTSDDLKEFVNAQKALGLSSGECEELLYELATKLFNEKKEVDTFMALKVVGKALVSYFDLVTDVMVFFELLRKNLTMAVVQGVTLGFSMVLQSLLSWLVGQPKLVALSGLLGCKPMIEAWRDATDAKPYQNQKVKNSQILGMSRMLEITTEAIPQSVIQSIIFLLFPDQRTTVQMVSLFASFLTTGFTVAFAARDTDTSKYQRKAHPKLNGYVPSTNGNVQAFFSVVFITTYTMAKMFALSLFIATSSSAIWTVVNVGFGIPRATDLANAMEELETFCERRGRSGYWFTFAPYWVHLPCRRTLSSNTKSPITNSPNLCWRTTLHVDNQLCHCLCVLPHIQRQ